MTEPQAPADTLPGIPPETGRRPFGRGLLRLCAALVGLLLFVYVIGPFLVNHIAPFKRYARTVDETGIMPGALYYTDVPQSTDAEMHNRDAVRRSGN